MTRSISECPPEIDSLSLEQAYGAFTTEVAVIGTHANNETPIGTTVNSFTTVSLIPPLISFCPSRSCFAFPIYCTMKHFSANILQENQRSISDRFARSSQGSKWEGVRFRLDEYAAPLIEDALASFECAVQDRVEAGDHTIVIGRVLRIHGLQMAEPLLFYRSQYRGIRELDIRAIPTQFFWAGDFNVWRTRLAKSARPAQRVVLSFVDRKVTPIGSPA